MIVRLFSGIGIVSLLIAGILNMKGGNWDYFILTILYGIANYIIFFK